MFCDKCGSPLPNGAKFCAKCGNAVKAPQKKETVSFNNIRKPLIIGAGTVILLLLLIVGIRSGHSKQKYDTAAASNQEEADTDTEEITTSSAITLQGNYVNLKSVVMLGTADGAVPAITYHEDSAFPVLESLQCGAVIKTSDSGETGYFNETDFPALKSVEMRLIEYYPPWEPPVSRLGDTRKCLP